MIETGTIREIKENLVIVAPVRTTACAGCSNQECRADSGFIIAENPRALSLKTGQTVEVSTPAVSILGQALVSLLPPALGFVAGYVFLRLLFPHTGEGAAAALGVVFLFAAAFIVYSIRRRRPGRTSYSVTRIIT